MGDSMTEKQNTGYYSKSWLYRAAICRTPEMFLRYAVDDLLVGLKIDDLKERSEKELQELLDRFIQLAVTGCYHPPNKGSETTASDHTRAEGIKESLKLIDEVLSREERDKITEQFRAQLSIVPEVEEPERGDSES